MGFFSNLKNKARRQVAPVMPMAPQPMPRVPVMPQRPRMPEALPPRRGPMNRGIPGLMNQMEGQPRMMMAVGGPLMGRAANISRQVLRDKRGTNKFFPDRFGNVPPISDRILGSPGRGQPGALFYGANDLNRIKNAENAIIAGGGLGVAGMIDATNMFSEPASMDNISFMSPEAMGTDLANLRVGIDRVIDLARNKASEMGADINEYVDRTKSAYDQQMENQRMQELDAEQGMQPFSFLMGPDMPLTRPEETDPRVNRMIESGRGRTVSDMDRESLDDILSDLEKKKLDSPPEESISVKDVTDIFFDPTDPVDYAALAGGPFIKAGLSAKKAKRLYDSLQRIRQRKRQAQVDFKRGQAEDRVGELGGRKLMKKSSDTFKELSINEEKILKQLEGYQPELL